MAEPTRKLKLPSVKRLREAILYDPHTGELFWKWRPSHHFKQSPEQAAAWNVKHAGALCGKPHISGYIQISFPYPILAHRIAWAIMNGRWSSKTIDHRNCNRHDNRWCNLREATRLQQTWNRGNIRKRVHKAIPKGVLPRDGKFHAYIGVNRRRRFLGKFDTAEEAHAAWAAAAQKLHGEFFNPF